MSPHGRLALKQRAEQQQEREKVRNGRLRAYPDVVDALATMVTSPTALFRALKSQSQSRDAQATNRVQGTVVMPTGSDLTTRLGGIARLGQVASRSTLSGRVSPDLIFTNDSSRAETGGTFQQANNRSADFSAATEPPSTVLASTTTSAPPPTQAR